MKTTTQTTGGGQAGGGKNVLGSQSSSQSNKVEIEEYRYFANAAYAHLRGADHRIGRIWADGKILDQSAFTLRRPSRRRGQDRRRVDRREGRRRRQAPAYRGTAYVVFEEMPLERFGNRLPQLTFEVFRRSTASRGAGCAR